MATMEKLAQLLSGRPDIGASLSNSGVREVGRRGTGAMMKSENRFEAAQSDQDAEGCTDASEADLATRCTSNEVVALEKGDWLLLQLNERLAPRARWLVAVDSPAADVKARQARQMGRPPVPRRARPAAAVDCRTVWASGRKRPPKRSGHGRRGTARTSPVRQPSLHCCRWQRSNPWPMLKIQRENSEAGHSEKDSQAIPPASRREPATRPPWPSRRSWKAKPKP